MINTNARGGAAEWRRRVYDIAHRAPCRVQHALGDLLTGFRSKTLASWRQPCKDIIEMDSDDDFDQSADAMKAEPAATPCLHRTGQSPTADTGVVDPDNDIVAEDAVDETGTNSDGDTIIEDASDEASVKGEPEDESGETTAAESDAPPEAQDVRCRCGCTPWRRALFGHDTQWCIGCDPPGELAGKFIGPFGRCICESCGSPAEACMRFTSNRHLICDRCAPFQALLRRSYAHRGERIGEAARPGPARTPRTPTRASDVHGDQCQRSPADLGHQVTDTTAPIMLRRLTGEACALHLNRPSARTAARAGEKCYRWQTGGKPRMMVTHPTSARDALATWITQFADKFDTASRGALQARLERLPDQPSAPVVQASSSTDDTPRRVMANRPATPRRAEPTTPARSTPCTAEPATPCTAEPVADTPVCPLRETEPETETWSDHLSRADAIDPAAELRCPVRTMRHAPKGLRHAVADIMVSLHAALADAVEDGDSRRRGRLERLWLLLPRLLLTQPPPLARKPASKRARHAVSRAIADHNAKFVGERLARFNRGEWTALLLESRELWPTAARVGWDEDSAARKTADRVISSVACGQIGRAAGQLTSPGVAPADEATAAAVRELLEQHPGRSAPPWSWTAKRRTECVVLTPQSVATTIREGKKGAARDLGGWSKELLCLFLDSADALNAATRVINALISARLSPECYQWLDYSRVTPLRKTGQRVRPLAGASIWRCAAMATVCRDAMGVLRRIAGDEQFAIGTAGAVEKMAFTINALMKDADDLAVCQLDCTSAFNGIYREVILEELEEMAPQLLTPFAIWLARESMSFMIMDTGEVATFVSRCGIDQGSPESPAAFAVGLRRVLRRIREAAVETKVLSFLDDLTLATREADATDALDVVIPALADSGLALNEEKSVCWTASGQPPAGERAGRVWHNAERHDGILVCGTPMGSSTDYGAAAFTDNIIPCGSDEYVAVFLAEKLDNLRGFMAKLCSVPNQCSPNRPALQACNMLLRRCGSQKVTHLLRTIAPDLVEDFANEMDELLAATFARLNDLPACGHDEVECIFLPLWAGGMGLPHLPSTARAAHVAAWHLAGAHVKAAVGAGRFTEEHPAPPAVMAAEESLRREYPALRPTDWGQILCRENARIQRILTAPILEARADSFREAVDPIRRAVLDSAGSLPGPDGAPSPGAAAWLQAVPRSPPFLLDDAAFAYGVRARLRLPLAPTGTLCAYTPQSSHKVCSQLMDEHADHAFTCCRGPLVARHHYLRDVWRRIYSEAGCGASTEQLVHELGLKQPRRSDAPHYVTADIRATDAPAVPATCCDVVVTHPLKTEKGKLTPTARGTSSCTEETRKLNAYKPSEGGSTVRLAPLAMETFGRWGPAAETELLRLARIRVMRDESGTCPTSSGAVQSVAARWRQQLSVALMRGNFAVVAAAVAAVPGTQMPCAVSASDSRGLLFPSQPRLWEHLVE